MPFRLNDETAKIQFVTSAETPHLIYRACLATDTGSNTAWLQRAVAKALAADLGLDEAELLGHLPDTSGSGYYLRHRQGHGHTSQAGQKT